MQYATQGWSCLCLDFPPPCFYAKMTGMLSFTACREPDCWSVITKLPCCHDCMRPVIEMYKTTVASSFESWSNTRHSHMGVWIPKRGLAVNPIYHMSLHCNWHLHSHRKQLVDVFCHVKTCFCYTFRSEPQHRPLTVRSGRQTTILTRYVLGSPTVTSKLQCRWQSCCSSWQ